MSHVWLFQGVIHFEEDQRMLPSVWASEDDAVKYMESIVFGANELDEGDGKVWKIEETKDITDMLTGEHLGKVIHCSREDGATADMCVEKEVVL